MSKQRVEDISMLDDIYPRPGIGVAKKTYRGFTLVELMMGLVLIAILLGIGAPGFQSFILDQRLRATSADLRMALTTARSEAVKRNRNVQLAPKVGGWSSGWTIPNPEAGAPTIMDHVQSGDVSIVGPTSIVFTSSGRTLGAVDLEIDVSAGAFTKITCLQLQLDGRTVAKKGACS